MLESGAYFPGGTSKLESAYRALVRRDELVNS